MKIENNSKIATNTTNSTSGNRAQNSAKFSDELANLATKETEETKEATAMVEYKEVDEPCVALTIIGENRLTDAEVFVRRGFRFSLKAFFSTIVLTIMNMFI